MTAAQTVCLYELPDAWTSIAANVRQCIEASSVPEALCPVAVATTLLERVSARIRRRHGLQCFTGCMAMRASWNYRLALLVNPRARLALARAMDEQKAK